MKIIVSVGHTLTGRGSGAVGILNESKENRNVAQLVKKYFEEQGHQVVYLQIDSIGASEQWDYVQRTAQANKYNADLFVEIHFNASNGAGKGTEVFYTSEKGKPFAQKITNAIAELGFSNRGAKHTDSLYVLNNTKMPAVLVECCFVDNKEDTDRYKQVGADKVARKIVKGITGVEPVDKPVSTSPAKEEKAPAGQYYRVQLGAYTYKKYAEEMLEKLKKAGFDTYMVQSNGYYKVQVGAYSIKENADNTAKKLKEKGFDVYITTEGGTAVSNSTTPIKEIKVGSKVKVKKGAKSYNGVSVAPFVYEKVYTVDEIKGDRVVLDKKGICTPFKLCDLILQ